MQALVLSFNATGSSLKLTQILTKFIWLTLKPFCFSLAVASLCLPCFRRFQPFDDQVQIIKTKDQADALMNALKSL
jgi:hypothetical protein